MNLSPRSNNSSNNNKSLSVRNFLFSSMSSLFSSSAHKPSQFVVDDHGLKWRLCAGAAVFNSKNELLIGERIGNPGAWQWPQGGVDGGSKSETVTEAAIRELYEEVGLEVDNHVMVKEVKDAIKCRYSTKGTGSWMEEEGFAGQELNWIVFRCTDVNLECDPASVCRLTGLNGESAEFSAVRWASLDSVLDSIWEAKRGPYEELQKATKPLMKQWDNACREMDLEGKWSRDSSKSIGVAEGLIARGCTEERATARANEKYIQSWKRSQQDRRAFQVTTYEEDGVTSRRELLYPMGKFEEAYEGKSILFGGDDGGVVKRHCFYLAKADADGQIAHVTTSETPRGREESMRYLKDGNMILQRSFWHSWRTDKFVSTEVFSRS